MSTIKRYKKSCKECNTPQYIFSKGLCILCYKKKNPPILRTKSPIRKVSDKQKEILKEYSTIRKEYLKQNKFCKVNLPRCTHIATDIHHSGKKYSKELWLDTSLFIPMCRNCHMEVDNNPALAKELNIYNYKI